MAEKAYEPLHSWTKRRKEIEALREHLDTEAQDALDGCLKEIDRHVELIGRLRKRLQELHDLDVHCPDLDVCPTVQLLREADEVRRG